jgi:adenylate cyclase
LRKLQNSNLSEIIKGQFLIKKINISSSKDKSVFTLILPVSKNNQNQIFRFAAVDISTEIFSKAFKNFGASLGYLIDSNGQVLAQSDLNTNAEFKTELSPLAQNAITKEKNKQQFQQQFTDGNSKTEFIGAFVRLSMGPVLIFQSALNEVLAPAEQVRNEFIKNLVYVLSLSFLVISLFSMTLTRPIEKLAKLIPLVSKGDFEIHAAKNINSKDEVGDLAIAFDQMTLGLKERDKVKTLFQKFHGTHVANDIISSEITLGGANKEVVVFFSDIRGFTAFSESKSPEEVVEMLNEYFAVMVDIINRNAGVVDKFIGDAIMAVWGAPNQSERDAHNAVSACLQMRLALNELNEKRLALNKSPIQIGMGLHAGHAISGTIGSNERMEYTVIGNTVNTASRVEASTKAFGTDLLITQEVAQLIQDEFLLEEAGSAEVKGRSEALKFFKVKGYLSHETNEWVEVQTPYSEYEKEASEKVKVA